ncbi:hypothetical protein D3C71_1869890 [compost metagenome]
MKPRMNRASVSRNGGRSRLGCIALRHSAVATASVNNGTGESHQKLPSLNQRAIRRESRNGNHALTRPMNTITATTSGRVKVRAKVCSRPSVLRINQVLPSSA